MWGEAKAKDAQAHMKVAEPDPGTVRLVFSGRLDAVGVGKIWLPTVAAAERAHERKLELDLSAVEVCDTAGATLLAAAEAAYGKAAEVLGASSETWEFLKRVRGVLPPPGASPLVRGRKKPEEKGFARAAAAAVLGVAFLGEVATALINLHRRLRMLRPGDLLRLADTAGVQALPLTILVGFLLGVILAFQGSLPMRQFGAELFVADLVTVAVLRELGAVLAAVILAGRTGSAFAAEVGTMKINQELDALVTMGLDAATFLVLPRLIAVIIVMPAITLVLDVSALIGMLVAMRGFGFPFTAIINEALRFASVRDLLGGLFKGSCFGLAIAAIGCQSGLTVGKGPRAVGEAATRAVVGGIVAILVLDGIFALIFYQLGI
ncbi:MAG: ABC transporter permease [Acidobacteriia bacterium]|nr:ABC transporter permease [Methyloceanibacter sp.]MCL6491134.1 ABC transporter permease [Terriglobia bacterium]